MSHPPVLLVGNFLSRHGLGRAVGEDLSEHLHARGWQVITTSHQRSRALRLADMLTTALKQRNQYRLALVEVYSGAAFRWAEAVCLILRWLKKPYILWLHGGNLPHFAQKCSGRVSRLLRHAHAVVAPSAYLQEHMRLYRQDILLIPNPLEIRRYPFRLRRDLRPSLVWLRAFHAIYRPAMAVEVLRRVKEWAPDVHLTMYGPEKGDGSLQEVRRTAQRYGLEGALSLPGRVPKEEVPQVLQQGDIFLNTAGVDNTPVSVMEAMACGLCVVSTRVGGTPYLLQHEQDALLVPPADADAMAEAVLRLLREPDLAERLSCSARRKAEAFDWSVVLPQWEKLFDEVFAHG
ncbi:MULTISPECIES: glycosyltransferase family 4 protein [Anaerolinea]|uniref:Glycosyltransferase n=1 Tax=Anaerolinea thermophila (strain DSM 14523 / JCM 11388 / NBRC 100420 / UNI-1) TaxID=926569 RepID=E8N087_ANATU|nr:MULTISPECIES: glycosyltransferase family 4 protein [Anaerolinea]BAJ64636.1 putative glycosyltransferase [Anaerolinea thermophila UNI-1]